MYAPITRDGLSLDKKANKYEVQPEALSSYQGLQELHNVLQSTKPHVFDSKVDVNRIKFTWQKKLTRKEKEHIAALEIIYSSTQPPIFQPSPAHQPQQPPQQWAGQPPNHNKPPKHVNSRRFMIKRTMYRMRKVRKVKSFQQGRIHRFMEDMGHAKKRVFCWKMINVVVLSSLSKGLLKAALCRT